MIKTALIVFLKCPEKGKVKTRLSRDLDESFVLELYKAFVSDLVEKLGSIENKRFFVWPSMEDFADHFEKKAGLTGKSKTAPGKIPERINDLRNLIGEAEPFFPQKGDHIGQKMANAFESVFNEGYEQAVLIGTDIPEIRCDVILKAYEMLETHKAVLGPSTDGGYYLIGFQKSGFSKTVFDSVEWSTPKVLSQTLVKIKQLGIACSLLPEFNDIDTVQDLRALALRSEDGNEIGPQTRKMLKQL